MPQIEVPGGQASQPKVLGAWGGLNTHADRAALPENDFSWLENFFPIAPGNLRTLYAEGPTVYTTAGPRTIINMYPYNLGATAYVALFLDDGSALQIKVSDGSSVTIGAAATFYSAGAIPACSQYQSKYLIIGSDVAANAYWVWDGTALFGAGGLSPQVTVVAGGSNYTSAPTITASGGSGSGATFSVTVANGQVTDAKTTNGGSGWKLGERVVLSFSGGGSDTEARAIASVTQAGSGVAFIAVTAPGSGYTSAPPVTFSGGTPTQTQATANFTVTGGAVTSVAITNGGSSYFISPTLTFSGAGPGTGAAASVTINSSSVITAITPTNGGSGYTNGTYALTISAPENPLAPNAISTINGGLISSIIVLTPGYGYTSPPTVTLTGGGGAGGQGQCQMAKGQIGAITVLTGGTNYVGTPTVTISPPDDPTAITPTTATAWVQTSGGAVSAVALINRGLGYLQANVDLRGGNNTAHATAVLMPFGIQATAIETYNNQVWTTANPAAGPKMSLSGPNSVTDFSTFGGGGSAPATDSFLRRVLIGLKQDNGILYRFADSSVNAITNVQTSSAGITTYNNANVDSQTGTIWRDTICSFDRAIVFASSTGVYALFGGAVQKVSEQLDSLFLNASFNTGVSGVTPTAAVVTIFNVRCYVLLFTTTDPYTNTKRNIMAIWNGQRWFAATQIKTLTLVALQELDSVFTAWGTDGTRLFKLFQTPSTSLTKVFQTRLDGANIPDMVFRVDNAYLTVNLTTGTTGNISMALDTEKGSAPAQTFAMTSGGRQILQGDVNPGGAYYGVLRGFTATTTAADLQLISIERLEFDFSRNA